MRRRWYCPNCQKRRIIAIPAVGVVGYATTGRIHKCWKCGTTLHLVLESVR